MKIKSILTNAFLITEVDSFKTQLMQSRMTLAKILMQLAYCITKNSMTYSNTISITIK